MSDLIPVNPLKDESNATAVINLVPSVVANGLRAIPEYVFDLSLDELTLQANAKETERKIRIAFWIEYERAHRNGTACIMANVYRGICSQSYFFKHLCTSSFKLAYIMTPPPDYRVEMEEMLMLAVRAERAVLETPIRQTRTITDKRGETKQIEIVDAQLASVQHKIRESIQNRLQGMPIHRSMQINENRNVSVSSGMPMSLEGSFSNEDLNGMDETKLRNLVQSLQAENRGPSVQRAAHPGEEEKECIVIEEPLSKDGK